MSKLIRVLGFVLLLHVTALAQLPPRPQPRPQPPPNHDTPNVRPFSRAESVEAILKNRIKGSPNNTGSVDFFKGIAEITATQIEKAPFQAPKERPQSEEERAWARSTEKEIAKLADRLQAFEEGGKADGPALTAIVLRLADIAKSPDRPEAPLMQAIMAIAQLTPEGKLTTLPKTDEDFQTVRLRRELQGLAMQQLRDIGVQSSNPRLKAYVIQALEYAHRTGNSLALSVSAADGIRDVALSTRDTGVRRLALQRLGRIGSSVGASSSEDAIRSRIVANILQIVD